MRGLFITGTDTDVGKTYVTASIARELRAQGVRPGVYKPACSGAVRGESGELCWHDVEVLAEAADIPDRKQICPQCYEAPLAPPIAARQEGASISWHLMLEGVRHWKSLDPPPDVLLVEGAGGILCPLTDERTVADLALAIGFPVLIVARLGLGTINHTLLTIEAARSRGLNLAGVILNDADNLAESPAGRTNFDELIRLTDVRLLGVLMFGGDAVSLRDRNRGARMNWLELADGT